jgi:glycosyltransferase involved in cell wall biosynthesis
MSARAIGKPVLFVTGHAPPDRLGAFARLSQREGVEFALFGGRSQHGFGPTTPAEHARTQSEGAELEPAQSGRAEREELPFPHRRLSQRQIARLAASGRYRAIVCSTGGRIALPAAWAGARRARVPVILWTSLWAHPRSPAHLLSYVALRRLYSSADAVVTYGPHVSAYVQARGARNVHVAPQSVDNDFWSSQKCAPAALPDPVAQAQVKFLFAGRPTREKGLGVLIEAWSDSGLAAPSAALVLVGVGSAPPWVPAGGAVRADVAWLDPVSPRQMRELYAAADVLVVPSIPTRTFREPWGLVVNEAMNRQLPVIASDAVGAAAGGLVRDGHNGLIVPARDARALASAMRRLASDAPLRATLSAAGARDVLEYSHDAWAGGFSAALAGLSLSREERW